MLASLGRRRRVLAWAEQTGRLATPTQVVKMYHTRTRTVPTDFMKARGGGLKFHEIS